MQLNHCIKGYSQGMQKVISPEQTCSNALRALREQQPASILSSYVKCENAYGIPVYRVEGSPYYMRHVKQVCSIYGGANGKGHTDAQALASGLMELIERYSCCKFCLNPKNVVLKETFSDNNEPFSIDWLYSTLVDDSQRQLLEKGGLGSVPVKWCKGYSLDGQQVLIPLSIATSLFQGTNGMAAGNTLEEALLQSLCEILERHCLTLIENNRLQVPSIDIATVKMPLVKDLIERFHCRPGDIILKDFSLGLGLPVIGAARRINSMYSIITAGVSPSRDEALLRALTESAQGEGPMNFTANVDAEHYFADGNVVGMEDVPDLQSPDIGKELSTIKVLLDRNNMKAVYLNTTADNLRIPTVISYIMGAKVPLLFKARRINAHSIHEALRREYFECGDYNGLANSLNQAKGNAQDHTCEFIDSYYETLLAMSRKDMATALNSVRHASDIFQSTVDFQRRESLRILTIAHRALCALAKNRDEEAYDCFLDMVSAYNDFDYEDLALCHHSVAPFEEWQELLSETRNIHQSIKCLSRFFSTDELQRSKDIIHKYRFQGHLAGQHFARGHDFAEHGKYEDALPELSKAVELSEAVSRIRKIPLVMGYCYMRLGRYGDAVIWLKKVEINGQPDPLAKQYLAFCYNHLGNHWEAKMAQEAISMESQHEHSPALNSQSFIAGVDQHCHKH